MAGWVPGNILLSAKPHTSAKKEGTEKIPLYNKKGDGEKEMDIISKRVRFEGNVHLHSQFSTISFYPFK